LSAFFLPDLAKLALFVFPVSYHIDNDNHFDLYLLVLVVNMSEWQDA